MVLLVPLAVLLFLAPGYLVSRWLASRALWVSSFLVSLLVLFHAVLLLEVCGLPVRFATVSGVLLAVTAVAAVAVRRRPAAPAVVPDVKVGPPARLHRLALAAAAVLGACLLLRCVLWPLSGYDTHWRWDFLARRILEQGQFDFYPPRTPRDFAVYFYPESIPPLVSLSYWWLYAAAGEHLAALTALAVVAQYSAIVWLTYRTGTVLFSQRAGVLAVCVLTTAILFHRAIAIGQETGLTALSLIALTYFIASAREGPDNRAMILAGLSAAVGALAREYGWAFLLCGFLTLGWRRRSWKEALVFGLTACAAAGPWYLRTLLLTGNPLFSNRLLGLPVNPVHAAIIDFYRARLGVGTWSAAQWRDLGDHLLFSAPLQLLLGPPAALLLARRHGYLGAGALLVIALCLLSVGYTSGGPNYALRVLAPALVLLSVTVGALLDRLRRPGVRALATLLLAGLFARAVVAAAIFPAPLSLPVLVWPQAALHREPNAPLPARGEELLPQLLPDKLPPGPGTRILAENPYAYAALFGSGYDVVPVWSPEVAFLFDPGVSAPQAHQRLWALGIRAVIYNPLSLNTDYERRAAPFFKDGPAGWKPLCELKDTSTIVYELLPPE